jgi:hypothetical protein
MRKEIVMIRKSTLLRLLCLTLLAVLATFGVFNVTAQPAYAVYCSRFFPGGCYSREASPTRMAPTASTASLPERASR